MSNQPQPNSKAAFWALMAVVIIAAIAAVAYFMTRSTANPNNANGTTNTTASQNANSVANVNARSNANVSVNTNSPSNTNTTVDTSGWKTYEDTKYDFSIKYPPSWTFQIYTDGYNDEGSYVIAFSTNRSGSERLPFLSVREDWSEAKETQRINQADPPFTKVTSATDISLGSIEARRLVYDSTVGLTLKKDLIIRGSTVFVFDSLEKDVDFENVVSTFHSNI